MLFVYHVFQSFAWSVAGHWNVGLRLPFCLDVCKKTFEYLDSLLRRVSEDLTGALDWPPPPQEKECIAVATLNLLRLQVGSSNWFSQSQKKEKENEKKRKIEKRN